MPSPRLVCSLLLALLLAPLLMAPASTAAPATELPPELFPFRLLDVYGRDVTEVGVDLVDWEGHLANPAITLRIAPRGPLAVATRVELSTSSPDVHFDSQTVTAAGAKKTVMSVGAPATFRMAVFPDRDDVSETHRLRMSVVDAMGGIVWTDVPVRVIDQDRPGSPVNAFPMSIEFGEDRTGFFTDPAKRAVAEQALADWAYFFADDGMDTVPANAEWTWIWNQDGFVSGRYVANADSYRGYLLYVYGIHSSELRSGGEGSFAGGLQSRGGEWIPLRRSGGYEAETEGNYNRLGWVVSTDDADWWRSGNFREEKNDLYSIALHEIGHAIAFNVNHPSFGSAKSGGRVMDPRVLEYAGSSVRIDSADHFFTSIDPASRRGAFGNEYNGEMANKRWVITKLDLLIAEAMGYRLRETSAFDELAASGESPAPGKVGTEFSATPAATGGVPSYDWSLVDGVLPPGLALDRSTGEITGTPTSVGDFPVTLRVQDQFGASALLLWTLRVEA